MPDNKTPKYQYDHYDFGDMLDSAVEAGSKIGSSVLGSIADALAQAGDAMSRPQPDSFAAWKRRLERKWKNGGQSVGVALTAVGWTFTGCFGITALVMGILTAVGAGPLGLTHDEFMAIPILFGVFTPVTLGFLFMAVVGTKQLTYFSRLRRLLRAANDWTCDLPSLARKAQIKQETAYATVTRAVGSGDLPNAAISDDYSTLYLDDSLMPTAAKPAAAPQAEPAEPLTDAEQFHREGMDFLNYLKVCRGKLGTDADEELAAMQKTCASIMGFVHNHPEQLNRVRRFREYYLPTTRKLLDTAQGLGDTDSANAAEIRRDITGILHTLNQAYEKLYDTLLQHDIGVDGTLARRHDGICRTGFFVECKPLNRTHGVSTACVMMRYDILVRIPYRGLDGITLHDLHEADRFLDIGIERHDLQDGVQEFWHAMPITAHDLAILADRFRWEIAIADDDAIAVPHLAEHLE